MARRTRSWSQIIPALIVLACFGLVGILAATRDNREKEVAAMQQQQEKEAAAAYHNSMKSLDVENYICDPAASKAVTLEFVNANATTGTFSKEYVPDGYTTERPEEVRYLIHTVHDSVKVGTYTIADAYQRKCTVQIIDLLTGDVLGEEDFLGSNPPYSIKGGAGDQFGDYPSAKVVSEWVASVLSAVDDTSEETEAPVNTEANRNESALAAALDYLSYDYGESPETLTTYLTGAGFSAEEAAYAVEHCNADWMEEAVKCSVFILENYTHVTNRDEMIFQLEQWGFTHDQAVYAADVADYQ